MGLAARSHGCAMTHPTNVWELNARVQQGYLSAHARPNRARGSSDANAWANAGWPYVHLSWRVIADSISAVWLGAWVYAVCNPECLSHESLMQGKGGADAHFQQ
jgi:hypothetical protein